MSFKKITSGLSFTSKIDKALRTSYFTPKYSYHNNNNDSPNLYIKYVHLRNLIYFVI